MKTKRTGNYRLGKYHEQTKLLIKHKDKLKSLMFFKTNKEIADIYKVTESVVANFLSHNKISRKSDYLKEKPCIRCKKLKQMKLFELTKTGRRWVCIECTNKRHTEYYIENKEYTSAYSKEKYRSTSPAVILFKTSKCRAKSKKMEFDLDIEFLENKWKECNGCCELSGIKFDTVVTKRPNRNRPSIDRIDSKRGTQKIMCG